MCHSARRYRCKLIAYIVPCIVVVPLCLLIYSQPELPFLIMTKIASTKSSKEHIPHMPRTLLPDEVLALDAIRTKQCQISRPNKTKLLHDVWHTANDERSHTQIQIYGVYLDDRTTSGHLLVRLFGVSTSIRAPPLFCLLWYKNASRPVTIQANSESVKDVGRGYFFRGVTYQEQLYNFEIPDLTSVPEFVSLVYSECEEPTNLIPVAYPEYGQTKTGMGICVPVSYGNIHPLKLLEWVEFNIMLGVTAIHIYNSSITGPANDVLKYYSGRGIVHIHRTAPPLETWCQHCQKLAVIPALNDCLYRNMHRYRYILVTDLDELIIPHFHDTIPHLLQNLEGYTGFEQPAFLFRNAYFFSDFKSHENLSSSDATGLFSIQYLSRVSASPQGYASKSVINPRMCIVLQNHYCAERTPEVGYHWTKPVDPKYALLHHYKKCHFSSEECKVLFEKEVVDSSVLKYKQKLVNVVNKARANVFL